MKGFIAAIRFLTILPIPGKGSSAGKTLGKSIPFFPLVGLLVGLIAAISDYAVSRALPPLPASVLTVMILFGLSGGLHMDGLADTADGFFSARDRDRMMEIMRDSRIGVMGVLAVASVLMLKVSLLTVIFASSRWAVILLMPLAGRAAIVSLMTALPYVRPEGGLATLFAAHRSWLTVVWSWGLLFALSGWLAPEIGLPGALLAVIVTALFTLYTRRKIGGYTGDTLGAVCELAEMAPLLAAAIYRHAGITAL
jgi:adenosylcobinamide-GDP ribazoletransferase